MRVKCSINCVFIVIIRDKFVVRDVCPVYDSGAWTTSSMQNYIYETPISFCPVYDHLYDLIRMNSTDQLRGSWTEPTI